MQHVEGDGCGVQVFLTPQHLAIAMEYAKGGNLFHYLLQHGPHCRLTEAKAQWIFQQLIIGLDYCHRRVSIRYFSASSVYELSSPLMIHTLELEHSRSLRWAMERSEQTSVKLSCCALVTSCAESWLWKCRAWQTGI